MLDLLLELLQPADKPRRVRPAQRRVARCVRAGQRGEQPSATRHSTCQALRGRWARGAAQGARRTREAVGRSMVPVRARLLDGALACSPRPLRAPGASNPLQALANASTPSCGGARRGAPGPPWRAWRCSHTTTGASTVSARSARAHTAASGGVPPVGPSAAPPRRGMAWGTGTGAATRARTNEASLYFVRRPDVLTSQSTLGPISGKLLWQRAASPESACDDSGAPICTFTNL